MATAAKNKKSADKELVDDPAFCIARCTGFCCKEYTVLITSLDVRRILDNIPGINVCNFVVFYNGDVETLNYYPKILIKGEEYCLGMHVSDKLGGCIFQTGLGICGIHTCSPMVCQTYPWTMDENEELITMDNVLCANRFMPGNPESTKATIRQSWEEIEVYTKKVQEWNEKFGNDKTKDTNDFLQFVNCWTD